MLIITSLLGSIIGFYVCFQMLTHAHRFKNPIRICMVNSMSLAFVFSMLVELTTGSKSLGIIVPMIFVCLPVVAMMRPFQVLDFVESAIANLMSVSMSVMLINMVAEQVIWVVQCTLVMIETLLLFALLQEMSRSC